MARPVRVLARRTSRLLGYWRSERRTVRQGLVALCLSVLAGFIAGLALAGFDHTLQAIPGLLVLIPASVGMRGTIFGAMGARLGTQVAAGLFEPSLREGRPLRVNLEVVMVSTPLTALYLALMAKLVAAAFGEFTVSTWDLITISMVGSILASVVLVVLTSGLAVASFRRGWDLDSVSTPIVTAIGDMIGLPAILLATLVTRSDLVNGLVAGTSIVIVAAAALYGATRAPALTRRILVEMAPIAAFVPLFDIFAGALLQANIEEFAAVPGLLILIPPFVSQAGALGGVLSARLSSKLQLGVITPRGLPETPAIVDGTFVVGLGLVVFTLIGTIGLALARSGGQGDPGAGLMIGGTLLAGVIVMPLILLVAYYVAVATSRFGVDPDNAGVPIITSSMDLAGISALLFVMSISGGI